MIEHIAFAAFHLIGAVFSEKCKLKTGLCHLANAIISPFLIVPLAIVTPFVALVTIFIGLRNPKAFCAPSLLALD